MSNLDENKYEDEIDFIELFNVLWLNKTFIIAVTSIFSLVSVLYSLSLANMYTAQSILNPTSTNSSSSITNQYSGLASLAGIGLPSETAGIDVAIAFIKSKKLVGQMMRNDSFLPDLMAIKKWNAKTRTVIYDENIYDAKNQAWLTEPPSTEKAYREFSKAISVSQNKLTKLVTISVQHNSPDIAQRWTLLIIKEVNSMVANMKIREAQNSIDFLNEQIKITPFAELRTMFYELIQQNTQSMMLAKVNPEYALTTIDPPLVPEFKSEPSRALICIMGTILGGMISVLIIAIRRYSFNKGDELDLFNW